MRVQDAGNRRKLRCRMHGGNSPQAPKVNVNGRYRHGLHTQSHKADMQNLREIMREFKEFAGDI